EAPAATDAEAKGAADAAAAVAAAEAPAAEAVSAAATMPAEGLKPDTRMAAGADTAKIGYLGVWATDAAGCASVDQPGATEYAVITRISLRQGEDRLLLDAVPAKDGKATLTAGDTTIEIVQTGPDAI